MKASKLDLLLTGAGILSITVFSGAASALPVTQADIDRCNQRAAEASLRTAKGSHETSGPQPGASSTNPSGGRITDSSQPGMAGQQSGAPNSNPTGGRITDSTQPGTLPNSASAQGSQRLDANGRPTSNSTQPASETTGMAPAGERDGVYRQAYVACLHQRGE